MSISSEYRIPSLHHSGPRAICGAAASVVVHLVILGHEIGVVLFIIVLIGRVLLSRLRKVDYLAASATANHVVKVDFLQIVLFLGCATVREMRDVIGGVCAQVSNACDLPASASCARTLSATELNRKTLRARLLTSSASSSSSSSSSSTIEVSSTGSSAVATALPLPLISVAGAAPVSGSVTAVGSALPFVAMFAIQVGLGEGYFPDAYRALTHRSESQKQKAKESETVLKLAYWGKRREEEGEEGEEEKEGMSVDDAREEGLGVLVRRLDPLQRSLEFLASAAVAAAASAFIGSLLWGLDETTQKHSAWWSPLATS